MGSSLQKIESRVEKGAVMIVHVLLAGFPILIKSDVLFSIISAEDERVLAISHEGLDCCMDVCSSYTCGSDIGLEKLSYQ